MIKNHHNLPEAVGGKEWGVIVTGMEFLFWPGKNVLGLDSGDSCTTL